MQRPLINRGALLMLVEDFRKSVEAQTLAPCTDDLLLTISLMVTVDIIKNMPHEILADRLVDSPLDVPRDLEDLQAWMDALYVTGIKIEEKSFSIIMKKENNSVH